MANFKCVKCSTSFSEEINGIVICPECGAVLPLPFDLTEDQKEKIYNEAIIVSTKARLSSNIEDLVSIFEQLGDYEDSYQQAERCRNFLIEAKKNEKFARAVSKMEQETVKGYKEAMVLFEELGEWKGSSFKLEECKSKLETLLIKKARKKDLIAKISMIACAAIIALTLIVWAIIQFLVPAIRYSYALNRIEKGEYDKGYAILEDLGDYKNAPEEIKKSKYNRALAHENAGEFITAVDLYDQATGYADAYLRCYTLCQDLTIQEQLSVLGVGSTVLMGTMAQSINSETGKMETSQIEWIILDKVGDEVLLVSKNVISATYYEGEVWSKSTLCTLLNAPDTSFYTSVFNRVTERPYIVPKTISTSYVDANGVAQIDIALENYVFLLGAGEAQKYFASNEERCAVATDFAKSITANDGNKKLHINEGNKCAPYWLRNTNPDGTTQYVGAAGAIYEEGRDGTEATGDLFGLRPAMWVKVN